MPSNPNFLATEFGFSPQQLGRTRPVRSQDIPFEKPPLPEVNPRPIFEMPRWDPRTMPMRPKEGVKPLNPRMDPTGIVMSDPLTGAPQQFPSGFDPTATSPGTMTFGGPRGDLESGLEGLRRAGPNPLVALAGMSQELAPGETPGFGQRREAYLQGQLAPLRAQQAPIDAALKAQHPAIQGLQELESQRAALPKQYEAAGRIREAEYDALGLRDAARERAQADKQAAIIGLLPEILERLEGARGQSREFSGSRFSQFEQPNLQHEQALQGLVQGLLGRPEFRQQ